MSIKSHFKFNKNQRNGIFFLLLLIVIFQWIYFFAIPINIGISPNENKILKDNNFVALQKQIDSLKQIESKNKEFQIFPFNPNYLDDYKGYSFGMTNQQIDKLFEYRKKVNFINSSLEFQKITGVSDSLLKVMTPYFKFPDWINEKNTSNNNNESVNKTFEDRPISSNNLNLATIEDLKTVSGIGDKLSERIIKYRDRLKGFTLNDQLYEVYGLEKNIADIVLEKFPIQTIPEIKKININNASLKELSSIIYINYDLAKSIVEYRSKVGEINNIDELLKIEGFTTKKINRIELYLTIE
jgi:competence ComEA-like helix-hairpin-helix protein